MENINLIIITGTAFTLLIIGLAAIVIFSAQRKKDKLVIEMQELELKKQKEIAENTLISQEEERKRISLELHDELGPSFTAAKMDIHRLKELIPEQDKKEKAIALAEDAEESLRSAIAQFSDLTRLLYPVILHRFGLKEALQDLIDKAQNHSEISFTLDCINLEVEKETTKSSLYRICQELCNNAIKHSEAKQVAFNVNQEKDRILFTYTDDGRGFDTSQIYSGLGMNSIRTRVEAIGGNLHMHSQPGSGFHIEINLPYVN